MSSATRSVSPGALLNGADEYTPGIFAHASPLQTFAAPLPPQHRVYVDEGNDDLVIIGPGSVTFSRAAVIDDSASRAAARQFCRSASSMESTADFGATLFREGSLFAASSFTGASSMQDLFGSPRGGADANAAGISPRDAADGDRSPDPEPSISPASPTSRGFCDALALRTKQDEILMAKRPCTRTSTKQHGGVAAVLHDPLSLSIYNLYYVPPPTVSPGQSPAGTAPAARSGQSSGSRPAPASRPAFATSASAHVDPNQETQSRFSQAAMPRDGPLDPLAVYQCRPKNVRFGNGAYPIRDFFWLPAPLAWASGGTKLRAPNSTQALLIVTEISLDIVHVFPFAKAEHAVVLIQRVTTRSDYCAYDRFSRVLVSINAKKPNIIKPYVVQTRVTAPHGTRSRDNQLAALALSASPPTTVAATTKSNTNDTTEEPELSVLTSAGLDGATDAPSQVVAANPTAASDAQFSIIALPQIKLDDSDSKILSDYWMKTNHMRPMAHHPAVRPMTLYNRLFVSVLTARQEIVLFELVFDKPPDLNSTHFERACVLCLQESNARHIVQGYDNLVLAHCVDTGLSFIYDIHVDETVDAHSASAAIAGSSAVPLSTNARGRATSMLSAYSSPGFLPGFAINASGPSSAVASSSTVSDDPRNSSGSPTDAGGLASSFGFSSSTFFKSFAAPGSANEAKKAAALTAQVPVAVFRMSTYASRLGTALAATSELERTMGSADFSSPLRGGGSVGGAAPASSFADQDAAIFQGGGFYSASTPMVLDRKGGRLFMLGMNHVAVAASMHRMNTKTMRYLASRSGAGASMAAIELVKKAIFDQEPLAFVGRMFDIVTERDYSTQSVAWHAANLVTASVPNRVGANASVRSTSAANSSTSSTVRVNPVSADGLFHARRAMPHGSCAVVGDVTSGARVVPSLLACTDDPTAQFLALTGGGASTAAAARTPPLTLLSALDAEQGLEVVERYARSQKAAATSVSSPSPSSSFKQHAASAHHVAPGAKVRVSQLLMLRLVFDPVVELLRAKRDQEYEEDDTLPRTHFYLRYLRAVVLEYTRAIATPRPGSLAVELHPEIQALVLDLCTMPPSPDYFSLHQMLLYRVVYDSIPVANRLLSLADGYPAAFQAALDMFGRLQAHDMIVEIYLRYRMPERAAKVAIATQSLGVGAATLLQAALDLDEEDERSAQRAKEFVPVTTNRAPAAELVVTERQRLLRPLPSRAAFAQVFAMLRPRLRVVGPRGSGTRDNAADQQEAVTSPVLARPFTGANSNAGGGGTGHTAAVQRVLSPTSQHHVTFPISGEDFERFNARFNQLHQRAMALSR